MQKHLENQVLKFMSCSGNFFVVKLTQTRVSSEEGTSSNCLHQTVLWPYLWGASS